MRGGEGVKGLGTNMREWMGDGGAFNRLKEIHYGWYTKNVGGEGGSTGKILNTPPVFISVLPPSHPTSQ